MSLLPIILMARSPFASAVNIVLSALPPNLLPVFAVSLTVAWWQIGFNHYLNFLVERVRANGGGTITLDSYRDGFTFGSALVAFVLLTALAIIIDLALFAMFARRRRRRRRGRKPPEIEAATRYFIG